LAAERHELVGQHVQRLAGGRGDRGLWVRDALDQRRHVLRAGGRQHAELRHVAADGVDERHALARQQLVGAMDDPRGLLLDGLERGGADARARHGLADRCRIRCVVLLARDIGLYVRGRDEAHIVPEGAKLAPPVVGGRASLHTDQAGRQPGEERAHLLAPELALQGLPALCVGAVHLEDALADVEPDGGNLAHGWPPSSRPDTTAVLAP
jgi:hypothetical protein